MVLISNVFCDIIRCETPAILYNYIIIYNDKIV